MSQMETTAQNTGTSRYQVGLSSIAAHKRRYNGLLKRSVLKNIRDDIFRFIDYINLNASSSTDMITILRYLTIIQLMIICCIPYSKEFWQYDTLIGMITNIVAIIAFISPVNVSQQIFDIIAIVVIAIIAACAGIAIVGFLYFKKLAKLHKFTINLTTVFANGLIPYVIVLLASYFGRSLYGLIRNDGILALNIIVLILSIIFIAALTFVSVFFVIPVILFRPMSVHFLSSKHMFLYILATIEIAIFASFGGAMGGLVGLILQYLSIIGVVLILIQFIVFHYTIISKERTEEMFGYYLFCLLSLIIFCSLNAANVRSNDASYIIIMAILIVSKVSGYFLIHYIYQKIPNDLNNVVEDPELFETLSYSRLIALTRYGFEIGNSSCHKWVTFENFFKKYPNDIFGISLFVRYASIYHDETNALKFALHRLILNKHGSIEMKFILFQVISLLQQREVALSAQIKKSIHKTSVKIEKIRGQIRYFWESIIKGNVTELESVSTHIKEDQDEVNRDFNQLCIIYPNNPYVAQSYAKFLKQIANNDELAAAQDEIYQLLRRGTRITNERCYFYANKVFSSLPTEEEHCLINKDDTKTGNTHGKEESITYPSTVGYQTGSTGELTEGDPNIAEEKLQRKYLDQMISSVKIPSMKYGPPLIVLLIIIVMPIVLIIIGVSIVNDIDYIFKSMDIVRYSALLRTRITELTLITYQTVFANSNVTRMIPLRERWEFTFEGTRPLPSNWTSDSEALIAMVLNVRELVTIISDTIPSLAHSGYYDTSLDLLYLNLNPFIVYETHDQFMETNQSLEYIFTRLMGTAVNSALTQDPISYLDDFDFWTMIKNLKTIMPNIDTFNIGILRGTFQYITDTKQQIFLTDMISLLLIMVLTIAFVIFLIYRLEKEKSKIFDCFKALPKSTLSSIVTTLNLQANTANDEGVDKENDNNQKNMSMQEENALRVLSTNVGSSYSWLRRSGGILCVLFVYIVATVLAIALTVSFSFECLDNLTLLNPIFSLCPYIHSLFNALTIDLLRLSSAVEFIGDDIKLTPNAKANYTAIQEDLDNDMALVINGINALRLESQVLNSSGLSAGGDELIQLLTHDLCDDVESDQITQNYHTINCLSYESGLSIMWRFVRRQAEIAKLNNTYLSFNDTEYNVMISWLLGFAKEHYTQASMNYIGNFSSSLVNNTKYIKIVIPIVCCIIAIILCGSILIPLFLHSSEIGRWSLRLLLFCNASSVLSLKPISKILQSEFDDNNNIKDKGNISFYETAVSHLLDGVLYLTNNLVIMSANAAVESILGVDPKSIIGKKLDDVLRAPPDKNSSLKAFLGTVNGALQGKRPPSIEAEVDLIKDEDQITALMMLNAVSTNGHVLDRAAYAEGISVLILVMKDITSSVASSKLLIEEGIKSEKLLLMILPSIIVNKLQGGEKNISFSVKSASIMFVDIVSFTPWCGSHPADYIMRTLNRLFAEFDRILNTYDRMTKIKCIGDCYMCAGGIFDEINRPNEHAKQAVSYGLDIIAALKLLNVEIDERLRIRVGVNTGGPIVAGVLGIEKPTFDILGPDICLAAMMEHHGVPMHVHIPQHCYDLIFGSYFKIKERGDVEVKGKIYHTYIVSGYDQKE